MRKARRKGRGLPPLTSVSPELERLLVPLAAVSRQPEQESDRCKGSGGPEHPTPAPQDPRKTLAGCQAAHAALLPMAFWMFETLPHSLKATLRSPPMASRDGRAQGSKGEQQHWGGEGVNGARSTCPRLRPGGGRLGSSPINDWALQHQHSQHAAGIPAALSRLTDGSLVSSLLRRPGAQLQKRPVPSGWGCPVLGASEVRGVKRRAGNAWLGPSGARKPTRGLGL